MSCRSTRGGTLAHRLARHNSGLPDATVQRLFHALKREAAAADVPTGSPDEQREWREQMSDLLEQSHLTSKARARSEHDLLLSREEQPDAATFYSWQHIDARARQQAALRGAKADVVDLAPPGAHAEHYELGPDGRPVMVWYASYGSNLDRNRFLTYLTGGTPDGSHTSHDGARDHTLPADDIAIRYQGRMHFAGSSGRWGGGGVAFIDPGDTGHALGRAYLISAEQFDDVVAQENARTPGTLTTPITEALTQGTTKATAGLYGTLVHIGDYQGAPVMTFTSAFTAVDALHNSHHAKTGGWDVTNTPHNNYLRMIGSGLSDTFGMDIPSQADYLRGSLGAHDISRDTLITVLSTPPDPTPAPTSRIRPRRTLTGSWSLDDNWGTPVRGSRGTRDPYHSGTSGRWADEWDSYRSEDRTSFDIFDSRGSTEKHWWNFDTDSEYEAYLTELEAAEETAYLRYCQNCGSSRHRLRDCPDL